MAMGEAEASVGAEWAPSPGPGASPVPQDRLALGCCNRASPRRGLWFDSLRAGRRFEADASILPVPQAA